VEELGCAGADVEVAVCVGGERSASGIERGPLRRAHTVVVDAVYLDIVIVAVGREGHVVEQRAQSVGAGTGECCCR
jgi:hypothetical protein